MGELEEYVSVIRRCDANIAQIEASIHALATTYEKSLRIKEQELVQQISILYGDETNEFIKRRDELDEYFEQIKNTCSLTELVIHGKDIELLLVKKQLMEKFRELESVELDPLPENVCMRLDFQPGELTLGTLKICEMTPVDDDEREGQLDEDLVEEEEDEEDEQEQDDNQSNHPTRQWSTSESAEQQSEPTKTFASIATQTDEPLTTSQSVQVRSSSVDIASHQ